MLFREGLKTGFYDFQVRPHSTNEALGHFGSVHHSTSRTHLTVLHHCPLFPTHT